MTVTPELRRGDLFAVHSPSALGWCIRAVQCVWSLDSDAPYNHVGIVCHPDGRTIEARWRVGAFNVRDYHGKQILIARHREMNTAAYLEGYLAIKPEIGRLYPFHRLLLFLVPPLAKISLLGRGVCSELTAKFMAGAGFGNVVYGITPDNLVDLWRESKSMDIIFEGVWK